MSLNGGDSKSSVKTNARNDQGESKAWAAEGIDVWPFIEPKATGTRHELRRRFSGYIEVW